MNYEGKTPCPGCNVPGHVKTRNSATSLCVDCSDLLQLGKQAKKEIEIYYVNVFQHFYAYYSPFVNKMAHEILSAITVPAAKTHGFFTLKQSDGSNGKSYIIDQRFLLPLQTLLKDLDACYFSLKISNENIPNEIQKQMSAERTKIFNEGIVKGRNLIAQLNSGEITLNEFENISAYTQ